MMTMHARTLQYGSVCSGIEAVTLAWQPLGLIPIWFAEVDPFANAVLSHHYSHVRNLGDMTCIARQIVSGLVCAPDILVGGTPCQSFSIAGLRQGLADPRGTLTLKYVELANAIDHARTTQNVPPAILVWENVPGVLSDRANAFGCFVGALAGEDRPLQPAGERWTHAGCVYGPQRAVAWRVLDAQHFGLAQRRKRVFVVASARDDFDPVTVLFESDCMCRDTPPRPQTRQETPRTTTACATESGRRTDRARGNAEEEALTLCFEGGNGHGPVDHAARLAARRHRCDDAVETFAVQSLTGSVVHPLTTASAVTEDGEGRGVPVICLASRVDKLDWPADRTPITLAFAQNSRGEVRLEGAHGQIVGALSGGGGKPGQGFPSVASVSLRGRAEGLTAELGNEISAALRASAGGANKAHIVFPSLEAHLQCTRVAHRDGERSEWLSWRVRRLMPLECERLQGLPDHYTLVPYRGKLAADGPRYKAIGNSMAVPCVMWIGRRLLQALPRVTT